MTKYLQCEFCKSALMHPSSHPMCCQRTDCQMQSEIVFIDDSFVINFVRNNPKELFDFLVSITFKCIHFGGVLEPFPAGYLDGNHKRLYIRGDFGHIPAKKPALDSDIQKLVDDPHLFEKCANCNSDTEIIEFLGEKPFLLLKFILKSNKTMLTLCHNEIVEKFPNDIEYIFKVRHLPAEEKRFQDTTTEFTTRKLLYHGSPEQAWHSVLRNGLKCFSNTKLMAHGAALGTGIYFGIDSVIPRGYSQVIAVCEVNTHTNESNRNGSVFVIKDEARIILRYIVAFKNGGTGRMLGWTGPDRKAQTHLHRVFEEEFANAAIRKEPALMLKSVKRLRSEFDKLQKYTNENPGIHVKLPNDDDILIWRVSFDEFSEDETIHSEMSKHNVTEIIIELDFKTRFSGELCNYPMIAPSVRVISPIFKSNNTETNIIAGGILCCDLLSTDKWSPIYSLENLVVQFRTLFVDERIECAGSYSLDSAKESYFKVAKQYNWF